MKKECRDVYDMFTQEIVDDLLVSTEFASNEMIMLKVSPLFKK